jgi:uroporphyrinogen III methyltransferase / synthase
VAEQGTSSLAGKRIVITRAEAQSDALAQELSARGAIPMVLPLISFGEPQEFGPVDEAIRGLTGFDWIIITSAQAARALAARSEFLGQKLIQEGEWTQVAAVGPASAEAAEAAGLRVNYVAQTHNGVALAEELGERLRGRTVLLPRSDRANPDLPAALKRYEAKVTEVIAYRTLRTGDVDQRKLRKVTAGEADAILFFSPSAVQHFAELVGSERLSMLENRMAMTAVGPVTSGALLKIGMRRILTSADTSATSVLEALEKYFAEEWKQSHAGAKLG